MDRQDSNTSPDSMNANKEESTKNDDNGDMDLSSLSNDNELNYLISLIRNLNRIGSKHLSIRLSEKEVDEIVQSVLSGNYRFEPLQLVRPNVNDPTIFRLLRSANDKTAVFAFLASPKDSLVQLALSFLLEENYLAY